MRRYYGIGILLVIFIVMSTMPQIFTFLFAPFAKPGQAVIYTITPLWKLSMYHFMLAVFVQIAAIILGVSSAIMVTRPWGCDFLPLLNSIASIGQTIPPMAVLALAVPILGFGVKPVFFALLLYGILPIMRNSLTAFQTISPDLIEAAKGQGLKGHQRLLWLELPLAVPAIISGIRTSMVITIGTAALGSTIAAKSLGDPIIAGLTTGNVAYVIQATILVALLAIIMDGFLKNIQTTAKGQIRLI